jgi:hypothetical protein
VLTNAFNSTSNTSIVANITVAYNATKAWASNAFNYTSPTGIAANITNAWNSAIAAIQKAFGMTPLDNGKTLLNATKDESEA